MPLFTCGLIPVLSLQLIGLARTGLQIKVAVFNKRIMNIMVSRAIQVICVASCFLVIACTSRRYQANVVSTSYHSTYDDTTLTPDNSAVLMPYNRFIDPAGKVIRFGKPALENHSLDCTLLSDSVLVVEDRYGVAFINTNTNKLLFHLDYEESFKGLMSTYSGLKIWKTAQQTLVFWGAANPDSKKSYVMEAAWDGKKATIKDAFVFPPTSPAPMALPNDIALREEGADLYLYVVLNGNSHLTKVRVQDKKTIWTTGTGMAPFGIALAKDKAYVSNWAGPIPTDTLQETAGIPYAKVYVDPKTGATAEGTMSVIDLQTGKKQTEIAVGLHPNAVIASKDQQYIYVANGNSDDVSVISTVTNEVVKTIPVKLSPDFSSLIGDSPNALAINASGDTLYVANGMDNAIAVIKLGEGTSFKGSGTTRILGFIPTEAYPAGLALNANTLFVANLEGAGARVPTKGAYSSHQQAASISIVPLPNAEVLKSYTSRVQDANLVFRTRLSQLTPRKGVPARPVPERIGEPSLFKHVVYIIKENKTYDQVLGDMPEGDGMKSLCIYGDTVTPNTHRLAKQFSLLDNYYASGKSSAEGHSWTDAGIVTDYIEKNVRAWFRSYPHVLADALAYNQHGFIWNNAMNHGKTVRIYGEACEPKWDRSLGWTEIYGLYKANKSIAFKNETTISSVRPILSPDYPCFEGQNFSDQMRADAFIKELHDYEQMPGDQFPQLLILALPADHTAGMKENFPTPRAMVADNDLALGKIVDALTKSRFWDSTAVFVTEDDSQSGWDHVSAYRTTGLVLSPYSRLEKTVHTNYNQTCIVRTIEQILGLPPMNIIDATALPMFDCFTGKLDQTPYRYVNNLIPLDEMNKKVNTLSGQAKRFAIKSASPQFDHIDGGDDDLLNRILWFASRGNEPYPQKMVLPKKERKDKDDD
jgi:YVTN family beta-propeller protein